MIPIDLAILLVIVAKCFLQLRFLSTKPPRNLVFCFISKKLSLILISSVLIER